MKSTQFNRRTFTKTAAAVSFGLAALQTQASGAKILGANDRVQVGFIGLANRGRQVVAAFRKIPEVDVAALCDIDSETLEKSKALNAGPKTQIEKDFRKIYENKDIDAVVIVTPDHWHAIQTVEACKAGKDVYIEKPLSATVVEGRKMVEAARKYARVVQVGIHRRSGPVYREIERVGAENKIGRITVCRSSHMSNMYPDGMGRSKPSAPPANLDWELWLGPRAERPFQDNIAPYKFRWWDGYSSQIANNGVHFIDCMRWLLGEKAPVAVCAMGGKFAVNDDRTIPDTLEAVYQFASGRLMIFSVFEANGNPIMATDERYRALGYFELRGTKGTLYANDGRYLIKPENPGQFQAKGARMKEETFGDGSAQRNIDITCSHAQNFIDCMRSRAKPLADVEDGHRSTTMSLIANISLALEERLKWDGETEKFIGNDAANALLHYEYRAPWKLEV